MNGLTNLDLGIVTAYCELIHSIYASRSFTAGLFLFGVPPGQLSLYKACCVQWLDLGSVRLSTVVSVCNKQLGRFCFNVFIYLCYFDLFSVLFTLCKSSHCQLSSARGCSKQKWAAGDFRAGCMLNQWSQSLPSDMNYCWTGRPGVTPTAKFSAQANSRDPEDIWRFGHP